MDDVGPAPSEPDRIEIWISQHLRNGRSPEFVADELLKKWENGDLTIQSKNIVAKFCTANSFYPSLLRLLQIDLRKGAALPWSSVLETLLLYHRHFNKPLPKELFDATLAGATRDRQLLSLAATALKNGEDSPRIRNVLELELRERALAAKAERDQVFHEVQIFKAERMNDEMVLGLERILALFPNDLEARRLYDQLGERTLDEKIDKLKNNLKRKKGPQPIAADEKIPSEIQSLLTTLTTKMPVEMSYLLSVGLFQMQFPVPALQVLRLSEKNWSSRESLWEVELLLEAESFAEALGKAQILLNKNREDHDIVKTGLYFSAKAYHGLGDDDQACGILKGIIEHDPRFRDAAILLSEWEL